MLFQIKVNEQEDYTTQMICNVLIKVNKNTQYNPVVTFFLQFNFYNKIKRTTFLLKFGQVGKPNFFFSSQDKNPPRKHTDSLALPEDECNTS